MTTYRQWLPANDTGRDFIVGDLHGCLDLLQAELTRADFDRNRDRLFSVGDLIDRGPDSMGCLRLLREPWFYAVVGNHEDMLLSYYKKRNPNYHSAPDFIRNGGGWVHRLDEHEKSELEDDLLPRVLALPYVITVGQDPDMFHVTHAELMTGAPDENYWSAIAGLPIDQSPKQVLTDAMLTDRVLSEMTGALTWGRRLILNASAQEATEIETRAGKILMSQKPWHAGLSLTYVGHTPLTQMVLYESHLFIDRGAFKRGANTCLLVLNQDNVRGWLGCNSNDPSRSGDS
ncbi:metallophosphoesterase [Pollutimonas bauzanensis]|uniref:Serine/threonine protein phosphatase 1 n=1 Tax=Pollutimonas bauzanensis TaxID=658167 RepID=A0A1M5Y1H2_9BURK|nr:metallophosphoesterase [Pollutimonas bauzanensis]SHI05921.1 serine/threonine protein phosphatase 1 [Pollutimonas bauzanensis]SHI39193.1 serine/threonine protein phosphatase 1 [Pollutimonas bauzanensis]